MKTTSITRKTRMSMEKTISVGMMMRLSKEAPGSLLSH
jgi:hypothetical protein